MQKNLAILLLVLAALVAGIMLYNPTQKETAVPTAANIGADGVQVIDITAKGGYLPRIVRAKANTPTRIRVSTTDTYDCSVSLVIPKLNYRTFLSSTGIEEIPVPAEKATGTLNGLCSMGMYSFKVVFE